MTSVEGKVRYQDLPTHTDIAKKILAPDAIRFLQVLHEKFEVDRRILIERRKKIAQEISDGQLPKFSVNPNRDPNWKVANTPDDLICRHVEITGPCEAKMMINALNSGADVFMADIEDSLSPTWENVVLAQNNLKEAVQRKLKFRSPEGKEYALKADVKTTLIVRPRGWHMLERNFLVYGQPISASLFDFGLYFFHCAKDLIRNGSGPYFYLPKMEGAAEAALWNEVFVFAQKFFGIPRGTIRATALIETILAAYEMEDILYELREHAAGFNAGRWDYLFSILKKFPRMNPPLPDRSCLTMDLPFMESYCKLLVQTCHRHGAHAIGGMSAFIPSRRDMEVNETAFNKVRADKEREIQLGFDGSWVAHPDLVPFVKDLFAAKLQKPHQKEIVPNTNIQASDLIPKNVPGEITEAGIRTNISVALTYLNAWLNGSGAVAINNLMEDAATAEISRAQLWQWIRVNAAVAEGYQFDASVFHDLLSQELTRFKKEEPLSQEREFQLVKILEYLVLNDTFPNFLTDLAYEILLTKMEPIMRPNKEDHYAQGKFAN